MLDLNRLVGFIFHSSSPVRFEEIKQSLLKISSDFETDDVAVILGNNCHGPGEITGAIANAIRLLNDEDFVNMTKAVVKSVGEAELNSPKVVFIISDDFSLEMKRTIKKLSRLNATYDYEAQIHTLQVSPTACSCQESDVVCLIVDDTDALVKEMQLILKGIVDVV